MKIQTQISKRKEFYYQSVQSNTELLIILFHVIVKPNMLFCRLTTHFETLSRLLLWKFSQKTVWTKYFHENFNRSECHLYLRYFWWIHICKVLVSETSIFQFGVHLSPLGICLAATAPCKWLHPPRIHLVAPVVCVSNERSKNSE